MPQIIYRTDDAKEASYDIPAPLLAALDAYTLEHTSVDSEGVVTQKYGSTAHMVLEYLRGTLFQHCVSKYPTDAIKVDEAAKLAAESAAQGKREAAVPEVSEEAKLPILQGVEGPV